MFPQRLSISSIPSISSIQPLCSPEGTGRTHSCPSGNTASTARRRALPYGRDGRYGLYGQPLRLCAFARGKYRGASQLFTINYSLFTLPKRTPPFTSYFLPFTFYLIPVLNFQFLNQGLSPCHGRGKRVCSSCLENGCRSGIRSLTAAGSLPWRLIAGNTLSSQFCFVRLCKAFNRRQPNLRVM